MIRRIASLTLLIANVVWAQQKEPRTLPKWEAMDYGPFYSSSVTMPWSKDFQAPEGITVKAVRTS